MRLGPCSVKRLFSNLTYVIKSPDHSVPIRMGDNDGNAQQKIAVRSQESTGLATAVVCGWQKIA